jgi:ABC-type Na+ transport system ATPase subunit NatA
MRHTRHTITHNLAHVTHHHGSHTSHTSHVTHHRTQKAPPIMVLDEATSSLDSLTERLIQDSLAAIRGTCTQVCQRVLRVC